MDRNNDYETVKYKIYTTKWLSRKWTKEHVVTAAPINSSNVISKHGMQLFRN